MYFNIKIKEKTGELKKDGTDKIVVKEFVVQDEVAAAAIVKLEKYLAKSNLDYDISKVSDTKIEAVLK